MREVRGVEEDKRAEVGELWREGVDEEDAEGGGAEC